MPHDFKRLGVAVRQAREARGWRQEDLAAAAHIGLSSVQNTEAARPFTRTPTSHRKIEAALGWEPGSCAAILRGGEPTPRREGTPPPPPRRPTGTAPPVPDTMPIPLRLALEEGNLLDYEVVTFDVEGEPVTFGAFVKSGVSLDEESREVLRKQLEAFGRVRGHIRREAQAPDVADGADAQSDDD